VTRIVDDQRLGIQQVLAYGLARGDNQRVTALDIVGRVSRVTGRREGGVIGLTAAQEQFVARAKQELASGEPEQLKHYLTRERRDKRFDALAQRAIRARKPVAAEDLARVVGRYSERLLALRGEMLARTETMAALGTSRDHAMRQAIASLKVAADAYMTHLAEERSDAEKADLQAEVKRQVDEQLRERRSRVRRTSKPKLSG
jgi:hypothetical protein